MFVCNLPLSYYFNKRKCVCSWIDNTYMAWNKVTEGHMVLFLAPSASHSALFPKGNPRDEFHGDNHLRKQLFKYIWICKFIQICHPVHKWWCLFIADALPSSWIPDITREIAGFLKRESWCVRSMMKPLYAIKLKTQLMAQDAGPWLMWNHIRFLLCLFVLRGQWKEHQNSFL